MSTQTAVAPSTAARVLDEGYGPGAWHGPDLKAALADVSPRTAFWRPGPGRHSVAEIALHHAWCVRSVIDRLTGKDPEPFPLAGEDWFALSDGGPLGWAEIASLVERYQTQLVAVVADIGARALRPGTRHHLPRDLSRGTGAARQGTAGGSLAPACRNRTAGATVSPVPSKAVHASLADPAGGDGHDPRRDPRAPPERVPGARRRRDRGQPARSRGARGEDRACGRGLRPHGGHHRHRYRAGRDRRPGDDGQRGGGPDRHRVHRPLGREAQRDRAVRHGLRPVDPRVLRHGLLSAGPPSPLGVR